MYRTGIIPADALALYKQLLTLPGIIAKGLHAYDGHLRDADFALRTQKCNEAFAAVVTNGKVTEYWNTVARNRVITIKEARSQK